MLTLFKTHIFKGILYYLALSMTTSPKMPFLILTVFQS